MHTYVRVVLYEISNNKYLNRALFGLLAADIVLCVIGCVWTTHCSGFTFFFCFAILSWTYISRLVSIIQWINIGYSVTRKMLKQHVICWCFLLRSALVNFKITFITKLKEKKIFLFKYMLIEINFFLHIKQPIAFFICIVTMKLYYT